MKVSRISNERIEEISYNFKINGFKIIINHIKENINYFFIKILKIIFFFFRKNH